MDAMRHDPLRVLQAASRRAPAPAQPRLLLAGATGVLGNEVLRRLLGSGAYQQTQVLAREPITEGLRGVRARVVEGDDPAQWPPARADTGIVLFDPPRLFYQRERALWTPAPGQLVAGPQQRAAGARRQGRRAGGRRAAARAAGHPRCRA